MTGLTTVHRGGGAFRQGLAMLHETGGAAAALAETPTPGLGSGKIPVQPVLLSNLVIDVPIDGRHD